MKYLFIFLIPETNQYKIKFSFSFSLFLFICLLFLTTILNVTGCAPSKRFTAEEEKIGVKTGSDNRIEDSSVPETIDYDFDLIRVLLNEFATSKTFTIESPVELLTGNTKIAVINPGNKISVNAISNLLKMNIQNKTFSSEQFILSPAEGNKIIKFDGKQFRGKIKIVGFNNKINVVNQITLEDYVKGVMTREMPVGKGLEHYEALKAFSICVRTYAYNKLFEGKTHYDILPDTRDQVYGGVDSETDYSNKIVDETQNLILTYDQKPAIIFYHSTCGGFTEDAANVFTNAKVPYLRSVKDGSLSNCIISPRYEWKENIPEYRIIQRLFNTGRISSKDYTIKSVNINSRFESGRINELEFVLAQNNGTDKKISVFGNNIRSVIRTADDKSILRSNFFEIRLSSNRTVMINGRGNGHGVGMCQWGAIGLSKNGTDYKQILELYYPGTEIRKIK